MKKVLIGFLIGAALIGLAIGMYRVGYNNGKNHVIYTQEIYNEGGDKYIVVVDGDAHNYN